MWGKYFFVSSSRVGVTLFDYQGRKLSNDVCCLWSDLGLRGPCTFNKGPNSIIECCPFITWTERTLLTINNNLQNETVRAL